MGERVSEREKTHYVQDLSLNPAIHPARSTQVAALSLCPSKSTELHPARDMG